MIVKIMSKDMRITPDIEQSVEKKLTQRLKRYSQKQDGEPLVTVKASEKKPFTRVDIDMPYLRFHIHAEAETADGILGGVDKCVDILERQIEKYKTRMHKSRVKSAGFKKEILDIVNDDELIAPVIAESADEPMYKIIKVDGRPTPMTIDEAILQMEVLDYRFLVFYNLETEVSNIIYRRDDGNIGLIEA